MISRKKMAEMIIFFSLQKAKISYNLSQISQNSKVKIMLEKAIKKRYSCRKFHPKTAPNELISEILDLTRLSPSSCGLEPWIFQVVSKTADLAQLGEICNQQSQVAQCSHAIIIASRNDLKTSDEYLRQKVTIRANTPEKWEKAMKFFHDKFDDKSLAELNTYATKQCYIAVANLVNIAYEKGLQSCIIAGFDGKKLTDFMQLDAQFTPVLVVALGYGDENTREKSRNSLANCVIWK